MPSHLCGAVPAAVIKQVLRIKVGESAALPWNGNLSIQPLSDGGSGESQETWGEAGGFQPCSRSEPTVPRSLCPTQLVSHTSLFLYIPNTTSAKLHSFNVSIQCFNSSIILISFLHFDTTPANNSCQFWLYFSVLGLLKILISTELIQSYCSF